MLCYKALEIATPKGFSTGKFHYVQEADGKIAPVGFCAKDCPGHDSIEQACQHYQDYLLATANYDGTWTKPCRCEYRGCLGISLHYVRTGGFWKTLCDDHRNPQSLAAMLHIGKVVNFW